MTDESAEGSLVGKALLRADELSDHSVLDVCPAGRHRDRHELFAWLSAEDDGWVVSPALLAIRKAEIPLDVDYAPGEEFLRDEGFVAECYWAQIRSRVECGINGASPVDVCLATTWSGVLALVVSGRHDLQRPSLGSGLGAVPLASVSSGVRRNGRREEAESIARLATQIRRGNRLAGCRWQLITLPSP